MHTHNKIQLIGAIDIHQKAQRESNLGPCDPQTDVFAWRHREETKESAVRAEWYLVQHT